MKNENQKLLPCPFCGAQPEQCDASEYFVECPSCGLQGPHSTTDSIASAIDAWNRRNPTGAKPEPAEGGEVSYTLDQIAEACVAAEIPDSKFQSLEIALADTAPPASQEQAQQQTTEPSALPDFDDLPDDAIDNACGAGGFYRVDLMRAWESLQKDLTGIEPTTQAQEPTKRVVGYVDVHDLNAMQKGHFEPTISAQPSRGNIGAIRMTTKPKAIELVEELRGETAQAKCNVVMLPRSLVEDIDAELRRLSALEQQGEAVAYRLRDEEASKEYGKDVFVYWSANEFKEHPDKQKLLAMLEPLYTHPAADLTDEQIRDAARYQQIRRGQHWSVINGVGDELKGDALDAATDAIIAKVKGVE